MYDVVIVGGGPGGISALIWCHRLGLKAILLEGRGQLGGQLFMVHNPIIDYPGIPVASGRDLQQRFLNHVKGLGCTYQCGTAVTKIDLAEKQILTSEHTYDAHAIILALGSRDRQLGITGEAEMIDRNEVYSVSRDKQQFRGRRVAVIGGGDRALEGALLLAENGAQVTLVHRSDRFRARKEFLNSVRHHSNIQLLTHSVVKEIIGQDKVEGIVVSPANRIGDSGTEWTIPIDAVFVRIGVVPNSDIITGQVQTDADGYVQVTPAGETSVRNVFAVGDLCTRPLYSSVAASVAQGMSAAKTISYRIEQGEETL